MRVASTALLAFVALTAAACSDDSTTGLSNEQAAVDQAYLDADPGYFDDQIGVDGLADDVLMTSTSSVFAAPGDPFVQPAHWGRRRFVNRPSRDRIVVIEGDTARVGVAVRFNGLFLVDTTFDDVLNPASKPLHETLHHRAVFVRDSTARHGWRLIGMSLGDIEQTDPERRTVQITSLSVAVNGVTVGTVTDPHQVYPVDGLPQLHVGDSVVVTAAVTNTTGTDLLPPTQLYFHVRHWRPNSDAWLRAPMHDNGDGTWTIGWRVRCAGIARMAVDAIDSEALQTQSGDNYRANLWAFPYRALN